MKSLRTKLIVICFLLMAVPSLVIGIVGYQISKDQLGQSGKEQLKSSVRLAIGMINTIDKQVKAGYLTLEEAQETIRQEILGKKGPDNKRPINPRYVIGQTGYLFAVNKNYLSVMNPTNEGLDLTNVKTEDGVMLGKEIVQRGTNGGGYFTYRWTNPTTNGVDTKICYVEMDPNWGWIIGAGAYLNEFDQGANRVLSLLLITLGIALLLGAIIVWIFTNHLMKPITVMVKQVEKVSHGDLTIEPVSVRNKDEIGRLAHGFNAMVDSLKKLIRQVAVSAEQVAASAEQLTASAEQSNQAAEHNAVIMQELAAGTDQQVQSIAEADQTVNEMSAGVQQISAGAQNVAVLAIRASEMAMEGNQIIQKAVQQMSSIDASVNGSAQMIQELGGHAQYIGNVIEVITGIAEQTNLLALNAAIEAARAGEHGRGFAVVADEVRKLAEESSQSAKKIADYVVTIQEGIQKTVQSMETGTKDVAAGIDVVSMAGSSFEQIQHSVKEVATQIQEVSAAIQQVSAGAEQVVRSIDQITKVAEKAAAGTQNVSASTQEQLASMEEITASAAALSKMADELRKTIGNFKLD